MTVYFFCIVFYWRVYLQGVLYEKKKQDFSICSIFESGLSGYLGGVTSYTVSHDGDYYEAIFNVVPSETQQYKLVIQSVTANLGRIWCRSTSEEASEDWTTSSLYYYKQY